MEHKIYGDRVSFGLSEKFFILRKLILQLQKFVAACILRTLFVFGLPFGWSLCNICTLLAYNRNLLCRTLRTVVGGNSNFLSALRIGFIGERLNACLTLSIFSAYVLDRPLLTASNTGPVFINFLWHRLIEERGGGSFPCLILHLHWVWTCDFV